MNTLDIDKEKLLDERKQKILYIIGFFVISIIGTLLHFLFKFSGKSMFIAPFSAVNESVWEHLKIAVLPIMLWTFIEFITLKFRRDNLWTSLLVKIITAMLSITFLYYLYSFIFKTHNLVINLIIFYFSILISQILGYKVVTGRRVNIKLEERSKYIVIFIFLLFIIFTFIPPKLNIFKDEVTSTYGVFEFKY